MLPKSLLKIKSSKVKANGKRKVSQGTHLEKELYRLLKINNPHISIEAQVHDPRADITMRTDIVIDHNIFVHCCQDLVKSTAQRDRLNVCYYKNEMIKNDHSFDVHYLCFDWDAIEEFLTRKTKPHQTQRRIQDVLQKLVDDYVVINVETLCELYGLSLGE